MTKKSNMMAVGLFFLLIIVAVAIVAVAASITIESSDVNNPPDPDPADQTQLIGSSSTALIWQTLYITNNDGSDYWVNAPKPFSLASVLGSESGNGDDFTEVSRMQNNIYANVPNGANSARLTCRESILITDTSGNLVKTIVDKKEFTGDADGNSLAAGQNAWITGASVSGQQLQQILGLPAGTYYLKIELSSINLTLDGQTYSAAAGTDSNVLSWLIKID